jgi:hypothetical protein
MDNLKHMLIRSQLVVVTLKTSRMHVTNTAHAGSRQRVSDDVGAVALDTG